MERKKKNVEECVKLFERRNSLLQMKNAATKLYIQN